MDGKYPISLNNVRDIVMFINNVRDIVMSITISYQILQIPKNQPNTCICEKMLVILAIQK